MNNTEWSPGKPEPFLDKNGVPLAGSLSEKIYLMAHSGGSLIGIQAAAQAPELYHAYIGMGQMAYQVKSEKLAYEFLFRANQRAYKRILHVRTVCSQPDL